MDKQIPEGRLSQPGGQQGTYLKLIISLRVYQLFLRELFDMWIFMGSRAQKNHSLRRESSGCPNLHSM